MIDYFSTMNVNSDQFCTGFNVLHLMLTSSIMNIRLEVNFQLHPHEMKVLNQLFLVIATTWSPVNRPRIILFNVNDSSAINTITMTTKLNTIFIIKFCKDFHHHFLPQVRVIKSEACIIKINGIVNEIKTQGTWFKQLFHELRIPYFKDSFCLSAPIK